MSKTHEALVIKFKFCPTRISSLRTVTVIFDMAEYKGSPGFICYMVTWRMKHVLWCPSNVLASENKH